MSGETGARSFTLRPTVEITFDDTAQAWFSLDAGMVGAVKLCPDASVLSAFVAIIAQCGIHGTRRILQLAENVVQVTDEFIQNA
ncbi:hypothetical protein [Roseicitreum antarcticum]|nr:hypothetical protein [Roseicitreum antarcticum]